MAFSFGNTGGGAFGGGGGGAFGGGGGFGAAPTAATGGAAASPFGGGGGTTGAFGAAAPSAFGGGGAFGSAGKSAATGFGGGGGAFGTTGAFGAQPAATTGGFGAPAAGGGGMFGGGGGAAAPGGFGVAAASPTGAFGAAAPSAFGGGGAFGGGAAAGGFGANTAASPFGAPKPAAASPFGQSSAFGAPQQTSAFGGGGGGFGTPAPAAGGGGGMFGGGGTASTFGAKSPSPFGTGASAFGAQPAAAGSFGGGGFGASPSQAPQQAQVGTGAPSYDVTREVDGATMSQFFAITRMPAYEHKSFEELRYEDYVKRTNPQQAAAIAAMNPPQAAPAQGATPGGFGAMGGFGAATSGGFGATPATSGGFGFGTTPSTVATSSGFGGFSSQASAGGGGGMFGTTTRSLGFGATTTAQPTNAFGVSTAPTAGGFGAPAAGGFGAGGSSFGSAFGAPAAQQPAAGGFGGFGAATGGAAAGGFGAGGFGKPTVATGGFGFNTQQQQQQQAAPAAGGFSFGQNAQQPAGGSLFGGGNAAAGAGGGGFSFGATPAKPAASTGFGGFGTTTTATSGGFGSGGGFGATAGGFGTGGFGATTAQPVAGASLFGGGGGAAAGGGGFGGFNTGGQAGAAGGTSLFGSTTQKPSMFGTPATNATGGGLFGQAATTGGSLFGNAATANKPTTGFSFGGGLTTGTTGTGGFGGFGSSFGSAAAPATGGFGGGGLFGSTQAQQAMPAMQQQQQQPVSLMATPDVNPYGSGAFGAGLVEQNVKAALDLQSLKTSSSAASRLSTFAQDAGLPRGPLENSVSTKRNLLSSSRYAIPVSFIREAGFKGTKSRFSTITSSQSTSNALRASTADPVAGSQDDEFKFSSSLFRNSVAKRLVIHKTDQRPTHESSSARMGGGGGTRASVVPFSEDESRSSSSGSKALLKPDSEGYYSLVFRTLTNKKSFTLRLKRSDTVKHARDDVKRLLRATMNSPVSDIQLLSNGRVVHDSLAIESLNLREGDVVDVAIVEDLTDASGPKDSASLYTMAKPAVSASESKAPQASRFMSYADFMNSAMREEQDQLSDLHKPVSAACPSLKNEDYYTVPSYDRLKRMTDHELAAVENFTVGCKGLGSVEWIGRIDVRHLDLDELIHFEKKEVIVFKDDANKHELGTGLNRPAIVELLGIFPPRKVTDPEAYKEKVKIRTRDIGSTYIDYAPATGIWRFRVEHFSRYGFDDDDDEDDEDMDNDKKAAAGFGDQQKSTKMAVPKRAGPLHQAHAFASADRVNMVRSSSAYRSQTQSSSRSVAFFREGGNDEEMADASRVGVEPEPESAENGADQGGDDDLDDDDDEAAAAQIVHEVPTSVVFPVSADLLSLQPLGIDSETSLLPRASKSTTYQMFLHVANQTVVAKNQVDAGLFLARSFRCSWGPNGELVNIGRPRTPSSHPQPTNLGRQVTIEFPLQQQPQSNSPMSLHKEALELHYECCQSIAEFPEDDESDDAPVRAFALPTEDGVVRCLHKYVAFAERTRQQNPSSRFYQRTALLWKLLQALWGQEHDVAVLNSSSQFYPLAARDDPREIENMETFQMVDLRREAISKWFEEALTSEAAAAAGSGDDADASEAGVLKLLCQHRIVEAAEMAMVCGDFRLSTLLAQAASYEGSDVRTLLADQLSQWSENGTLEFVEEDVVMIYSLLAGSVEVLTSRKEAHVSWLMSLALFFWYKRGPATSLKTALTLYRDAVSKHHAKAPTSESDRSGTKQDVLMEVMKLYVEDAVSLCSVLSPSGFASPGESPAHLDYELSWHLHSMLRAIGFQIERKWESHLHQNYIRQLEGAGLWEQAIYVSLTISDATERASTCRQLLLRNADLLKSCAASTRVELCDKYALPMEWIEEALAVVAVSTHSDYEEIAHWIAARQFQDAHDCLVRAIAPNCLFSGEKSVLLQLLTELEPFYAQIPSWEACNCANYVVGGGLLLEYLRLEAHDGLESGREELFLARLMQLADRLSQVSGAAGEGHGQAQAASESVVVVARTALSSMLVALSTQAVQLRTLLNATIAKDEDAEDKGSPPFQLQPDFLTSLSSLTRGRETKFVESYRGSQLLNLCASFVDWRT